MIIPPKSLRERLLRGEVILGLGERDIHNPEGAGFDLRLRAIYRLDSSGYLGTDERETSAVTATASLEESPSGTAVRFEPGTYSLVTTVEEMAFDLDMVGIVHPRTTLFRSGVLLVTGVVSPGYHGSLTFGLSVVGPHAFEMELGARFAHINLLRVEDGATRYRGQWQGGRVATSAREPQV